MSYLHNLYLSVDTNWLGNTCYWPVLSIHNPASHSAFSAATLHTADKQGVKQGARIGNMVSFQSKTQHLLSKHSASDLHFCEALFTDALQHGHFLNINFSHLDIYPNVIKLINLITYNFIVN